MKVLIIGFGSIGRRHAKIFQSLGYEVWVLRREVTPLNADFLYVKQITEIPEQMEFFGIIICNPSSLHYSVLKSVGKKQRILCEKPLVSTIDDLKRLDLIGHEFLSVGYMKRFHPAVSLIKQKSLASKLVRVETQWSEYIPDWHPDENYLDSYVSRKDLGGGVALTLSHDLDLVLEILDIVSNQDFRINYKLKRTSGMLNIEVDTEFELQGETVDQVMFRVYLNGYSKTKSQTLKAFFENGDVVLVDFNKNLVLDGEGNEIIKGVSRQELFELQAAKWINQKNPSHNELNRSALIFQLIE
jgi:predicted dehydrogenase